MTTLTDRLYRGPRRTDAEPLARATENKAAQSPTLSLFVLVATVGVLAYTLFLFNPENRGDWLPYSLVIVAEVVLVSQALVSMWTILAGGQDPRGFTFHHAQERLFDGGLADRRGLADSPERWPMFIGEKQIAVDVFITVYGEDLAKIRETTVAALALRGEHTTWILDDGRSDEVRDLAAELGANYVRRLSGNGAKAGNINHALTLAKGEYFAIFDADFVPKPDFLYETVPFFIDDDVAFVQTPQAYGNMNNLVSRGAGIHAVGLLPIHPAGPQPFQRGVLRRHERRLPPLGDRGHRRDEHRLQVRGRVDLAGAARARVALDLHPGDPRRRRCPRDVEDYTKQQMRWASGGFEILMQRNPLSPRTRLSLDQRLQYTVTATHYFAGITPFLLLMVPPMEIFFDLHPVDLTVTPLTWFLFYAGFYGLQMLLAFHTMGSFRIETLVLATVSFPIYIAALLNVFSGREQKWHVTGGSGRRSSPFNFMIPQVMVFTFLLLTSFVAISKDIGHQNLTLATAWNVTNTILIGVFIAAAFRESHRAKAAARRARKRSAAPRAPQAPIERAARPAETPRTTSPALEPQLAFATRRALRSTDLRTDRSRPAPASELTTLNDLSEGRIA